MATITLKGNTIHTNGELPKVGEKAKDFTLVKADMSRVTLSDFKGSRLVLNISPSIDTSTCAASVHYFNKVASGHDNTKIFYISRDLPFAQSRFCGAEGLENVITLSDFETGDFGKNYGLQIIDGPLQGLDSRVVIIIDKEGIVTYTQQVREIVDEPNYDEVLKNL